MIDAPQINRKMFEIMHMGLPALQAKFRELYGFEPKTTIVSALRKRLCFRVQELAYGGLADSEIAELDRIADTDPMAATEPKLREEKPVPGTRLTRVWHGRAYEALVRADGGYEFDGRIFRSLSAIASEITKSHRSGVKFFGLKDKGAKC